MELQITLRNLSLTSLRCNESKGANPTHRHTNPVRVNPTEQFGKQTPWTADAEKGESRKCVLHMFLVEEKRN